MKTGTASQIKEWCKNCLATTAITLIIISFYALFTGDDYVYLQSILPSVAVNVVIHLGIMGIKRLNLEYFIVEIVAELVFIIAAVVATGFIVGWFRETSPLLTIGIAVAVFALACLISVAQVNKDIEGINREIQQRREGIEA